ncbi:MAG: holo-[acyl-carrier protein] synthase [Bacillota bacterium]|nr:holo-[acyl-carrier protein] synthase [Bacillota bacterium]
MWINPGISRRALLLSEVGPTGVVGVGVDIVEVARIRELMERKGDRLEGRVFTSEEMKSSAGGRYDRLAGRFAAKEAVAKALGTGIRGFGWSEIEIAEEPCGKPYVRLTGRAANVAAQRGVVRVEVSIAHTRDTAIAFAVAIGVGGGEVEGRDV